MSLTYGMKCIDCGRYHYDTNFAIPLTDRSGCDRMICIDCLLNRMEYRMQKVEERKKKQSEIDEQITQLEKQKNDIAQRAAIKEKFGL